MARYHNRVALQNTLLGRVACVHRELCGKYFILLEERFLLAHFAYITAVALLGALFFVASEGCTFVDALFIAVSCVSCTGLSTVDVSQWSTSSTVVRHTVTVLGGAVFTSSYQPLLRWLSLTGVCKEIQYSSNGIDDASANVERHTRASTVSVVTSNRGDDDARESRDLVIALVLLRDCALICFITPLLYCFVVQGLCVAALAAFNSSHLSMSTMVQRVIGNFQSCAFLSLVPFNQDAATTFVLGWSCALGLTLCPVLFRALVRLECELMTRCGSCRSVNWYALHATQDAAAPEDDDTATRESAPIIFPPQAFICTCGYCRGRRAFCLLLNDNTELERSRYRSVTIQANDGIGDVNQSIVGFGRPSTSPLFYNEDDAVVLERLMSDTQKSPNYFHCFLFLYSNVIFLGAAFLAINAIQFIPYMWEQWSSGVLQPFTDAQKFNVAWSQSLLSRFSGGLLIDLTKLGNGHLGILLFCMYLPALPFTIDESVLRDKFMKGKQRTIGKRSLWRLFTSRLMWLLSVSIAICLVDGDAMEVALQDTHIDAWTRTVFEVVSGYSGSGLTLAIGGESATTSFSGSLCTVSKLMIMFVMFAGRHRAMGMRWVVEELDETPSSPRPQ